MEKKEYHYNKKSLFSTNQWRNIHYIYSACSIFQEEFMNEKFWKKVQYRRKNHIFQIKVLNNNLKMNSSLYYLTSFLSNPFCS